MDGGTWVDGPEAALELADRDGPVVDEDLGEFPEEPIVGRVNHERRLQRLTSAHRESVDRRSRPMPVLTGLGEATSALQVS
jgi:hypothetical protein